MQPLCWGHLRADWADRKLQTDFLRPDAMPIPLEQTLFLLMEIVSQEEACAKNEQELVISLGFLILENINLSCISHMLQVVIPYHNYD